MVARFLVTTALENTWPADDMPVLFLGEWCRIYERKSSWEKLDAKVAPYHWDDRQKLHRDYRYLQSLYEEMLSELAKKLNTLLHRVHHTVRYWRIIIGSWLVYFIQMVFDRWSMLRQVLSDNEIDGVRVLQHTEGDQVPNDMGSFIPMFISDGWNEAIYAQILNWLGVPVEKVAKQNLAFPDSNRLGRVNAVRRFKRGLALVAHNQ